MLVDQLLLLLRLRAQFDRLSQLGGRDLEELLDPRGRVLERTAIELACLLASGQE